MYGLWMFGLMVDDCDHSGACTIHVYSFIGVPNSQDCKFGTLICDKRPSQWAPPVISLFIAAINTYIYSIYIYISSINHSYLDQLSYLETTTLYLQECKKSNYWISMETAQLGTWWSIARATTSWDLTNNDGDLTKMIKHSGTTRWNGGIMGMGIIRVQNMDLTSGHLRNG